MIEAAAPTDEPEGALAVQTACTHAAGMAVLAKLDGGLEQNDGLQRSDQLRLAC